MKFINDIEIEQSIEAIEYKFSIEKMERRAFDIHMRRKKELIWFLSHNHIYTMGTSSKDNEIKSKKNVPFVKTNRGGKITYHGPGQRIAYLLINLENKKKDIRKFVKLIEDSAIKLLREFDIEAATFPDRIGIWVTKNKKIKLEKEEKIGAIGLRVKKWITYHGLSFNLKTNLDYYKNIDACGLSEYSNTSMQALGVDLSDKVFDKLYLRIFLENLKKL